MTLIALAVIDGLGAVAVSDILLSAPSSSARNEFFSPIGMRSIPNPSGNLAPHSATQKTIILGKTLLMFAGNASIAEGFCRVLRIISQNGKKKIESIEEILRHSDITSEQIKNISIIYLYSSHNENFFWHFNCSCKQIDGGFLITAGTGAWNVFEDLQISETSFRNLFMEITIRVGTIIVEEALHGENFSFLFGGWFEFTSIQGGRIAKLPYATIFWQRTDPENASLKVINYSAYKDGNLEIMSMNVEGLLNKIDRSFNLNIVTDFLRRRPKLNNIANYRPIWKPRFIIHCMTTIKSQELNPDKSVSVQGRAELLFQNPPASNNFIVRFERGNPVLRINSKGVRDLFKAFSKNGVVLSRNSAPLL